MKVIDSATVICILAEIKCPELIDDILKLNHELVISDSVRGEILNEPAVSLCSELISDGKIKVKKINKQSELDAIKKTYPRLEFGELDTILTCEKMADSSKAYCILDDKGARKIAKKRGVKFTGFWGILCLMRDRGILSTDRFQKILDMLKKSTFRLPKEAYRYP